MAESSGFVLAFYGVSCTSCFVLPNFVTTRLIISDLACPSLFLPILAETERLGLDFLLVVGIDILCAAYDVFGK